MKKAIAVLGIASALMGCSPESTLDSWSRESEDERHEDSIPSQGDEPSDSLEKPPAQLPVSTTPPQTNDVLDWIVEDMPDERSRIPVCLYVLPDSDTPDQDLDVIRLLARYRAALLLVRGNGEVIPADSARARGRPVVPTELTPFGPDSVRLTISTGLDGVHFQLGLEDGHLEGPVSPWMDIPSPRSDIGRVRIVRVEHRVCAFAL